jgi:hypothetical protein
MPDSQGVYPVIASLITVWFQVRVLVGPPLSGVMSQ